MRERRRFVRIPQQAEINYKVLTSPKSEIFFTSNLSQGGIRFFVSEYVAPNSLMEVRLTIKEAHFSFKAVVEVKWAKLEAHYDRYEVGAEFVNIPKEANDYLIGYIESILKEKKD